MELVKGVRLVYESGTPDTAHSLSELHTLLGQAKSPVTLQTMSGAYIEDFDPEEFNAGQEVYMRQFKKYFDEEEI